MIKEKMVIGKRGFVFAFLVVVFLTAGVWAQSCTESDTFQGNGNQPNIAGYIYWSGTDLRDICTTGLNGVLEFFCAGPSFQSEEEHSCSSGCITNADGQALCRISHPGCQDSDFGIDPLTGGRITNSVDTPVNTRDVCVDAWNLEEKYCDESTGIVRTRQIACLDGCGNDPVTGYARCIPPRPGQTHPDCCLTVSEVACGMTIGQSNPHYDCSTVCAPGVGNSCAIGQTCQNGACCGNGIKEEVEVCDGAQGCSGGQTCNAQCNACGGGGGGGTCTDSDAHDGNGGNDPFIGGYRTTESGMIESWERCIDSNTLLETTCGSFPSIPCVHGCVGPTTPTYGIPAYCSLCGNNVCDNDGLNGQFSAYNENSVTCPQDCTGGGGAVCGNNIIQTGEECEEGTDGILGTGDDDFDDATCSSETAGARPNGNLVCDSNCQIVTSGCTASPAENICRQVESLDPAPWTTEPGETVIEKCVDYTDYNGPDIDEVTDLKQQICEEDCATVANTDPSGVGMTDKECVWQNNACALSGTSISGYTCIVQYESGGESCSDGQSSRTVSYRKVNADGFTDDAQCPYDCPENDEDAEGYCSITIPCGRVVQLPFFGLTGGVIAVVLIVLIYYLISKKKIDGKKKSKR